MAFVLLQMRCPRTGSPTLTSLTSQPSHPPPSSQTAGHLCWEQGTESHLIKPVGLAFDMLTSVSVTFFHFLFLAWYVGARQLTERPKPNGSGLTTLTLDQTDCLSFPGQNCPRFSKTSVI